MIEGILPTAFDPPDGLIGSKDKASKKRKKVRSVWISFVGRIVAQFVGSAATILLGLVLLHKYQQLPEDRVSETPVRATTDSRVTSAHTARSSSELSLAVLPLLDLGAAASRPFVADSMTEVLTTDLAQVPRLHVISRTTAMSTKGQQRPLAEIASTLGVRYVLEGSVIQTDDRIRVTAQLIDAARDEHVWARRYDVAARDLLGAQAQVAGQIVRDVTAVMQKGGPVTIAGASGSFRAGSADPSVHALVATIAQ